MNYLKPQILSHSKKTLGTSLSPMNDSFVVDASPMAYRFRIFVTNVLEHNDEMINAVRVLEEANDHDVVYLYINTPGGSVDSALLLYNALINTKAVTIGRCSGSVSSAGTMIAMGCQQLDIAPFTSFLFHSSSTGFIGKTGEIKNAVDYHTKWNEDLLRGIYGDLFSEEEYNDMIINNKDLIMSADEFNERYDKLIEDETSEFVNEKHLKKLSKEVLIDLILGKKFLRSDTGEIVDNVTED